MRVPRVALGLLGAATLLPLGLLLLHTFYLINFAVSGSAGGVGMLPGKWLVPIIVVGSAPYVVLLLLCGWRTRGWVASRLYLGGYAALAAIVSATLFRANLARMVSTSGLWRAVTFHAEEMVGVAVLAAYSVLVMVTALRPRSEAKGPEPTESNS